MLKLLSKQQKGIGTAAQLLAFFTILAQSLSILKNKLLSVNFGASVDLDIYYTAFKIPDLIYLLIGGMVAGAVLIPIFVEKEKTSIASKEEFSYRLFNTFLLLLFFSALIVYFLMPNILGALYQSYSGEKLEKLIYISRLFLLSPIFMSIGNFFISINQRNKIFFPIALTGFLYNISIIFGILFLADDFGILGVAYSVILGAILFLLIQLPSIIRYNLFKYQINFLSFRELKKLFAISIPRSLAISISALVVLMIYSKLSDFSDGFITIFAFTYSVFWLPIALINSSYSQAMLPTIAKFYSQHKIDQFNLVVRNVFTRVYFLIIPITFFIFTFSDLIVKTLFGSKKFGAEMISLTSLSLKIMALAIPFVVMLTLISRIFYSVGRTLDVFFTNIFAAILIFFALVLENDLIKFFTIKNYNLMDKHYFYIIFAFTFSYIFASFLILFLIKRKVMKISFFEIKNLLKNIIAALISSVIFWSILELLNFSTESFYKNLFYLFVSLIFYIFLLFSILIVLKEKNIKDLLKKIF